MASTNGETTLADLERQAEARRAELADTMDELHNRVTPNALKDDVRTYARDTGQQMLRTVEDRARENPLQAAAIAAAVAYPVWRLMAKMPVPVLLIGAGLAMSRRNGTSHPRYGAYSDEFEDYPADDGYRTRSSSQGVMSNVKEKVSGAVRTMTEKATETVESIRDTASEKTSSARARMSDSYQSGRYAAEDAADELRHRYTRSRETVMDVAERYPVLLGGVAFAIGSLVALSLPVTRRENRLMGETSDDMKRRAQGFASDGLAQAKDAAQHVVENARTAVQEEGLTPEVARNTVRQAMDTARDLGGQAVEQAGGTRPGSDHRNS